MALQGWNPAHAGSLDQVALARCDQSSHVDSYRSHCARKTRIIKLAGLIGVSNLLWIYLLSVLPIEHPLNRFVLQVSWTGFFLLPAHTLFTLVPHELGHALAGLLAGLPIRGIMIGTFGRKLFQRRLLNCDLVVRSVLLDGYVQTVHRSARFQRTREFVMTLGGVVANAAMILVAAWLLRFVEQPLASGVLFSVLLTNGLMFLGNLAPRQLVTGVGEIPSDGAALLSIPYLSDAELEAYRMEYLLTLPVSSKRNA